MNATEKGVLLSLKGVLGVLKGVLLFEPVEIFFVVSFYHNRQCIQIWFSESDLLSISQTGPYSPAQESATNGPRAGSGPPSKIIRPAAPLTNCSNCMSRLLVLYIMNLPSLQLLVYVLYLWGTIYEKPLCAIKVLYIVFSALDMNCEN